MTEISQQYFFYLIYTEWPRYPSSTFSFSTIVVIPFYLLYFLIVLSKLHWNWYFIYFLRLCFSSCCSTFDIDISTCIRIGLQFSSCFVTMLEIWFWKTIKKKKCVSAPCIQIVFHATANLCVFKLYSNVVSWPYFLVPPPHSPHTHISSLILHCSVVPLEFPLFLISLFSLPEIRTLSFANVIIFYQDTEGSWMPTQLWCLPSVIEVALTFPGIWSTLCICFWFRGIGKGTLYTSNVINVD